MKYLLVLFVSLVSGLGVVAQASTCESTLEELQFLDQIKSPLGMRGFTPVPVNLANTLKGLNFGLFPWGTKVFVSGSKESAQQLHRELLDFHESGSFPGIYVVASKEMGESLTSLHAELSSKGQRADDRARSLYQEASKFEFYEGKEDGSLRLMTPEEIALFDVSTVQLGRVRENQPAYFYFKGMHSPVRRGVNIMSPKELAERKSIKKLVRRILSDGYKIVVNNPQYMREAIELSVNTERVGQSGPSHITKSEIEMYETAQKSGRAYNIVIVDASGKVVASTFGMLSKSLVDGKSVGYAPASARPETGPLKDGINWSKAILFVLKVRAHKEGYKFLDEHTVTKFTKEDGAITVGREQFDQMRKDQEKTASGKMEASEFTVEEVDYFNQLL